MTTQTAASFACVWCETTTTDRAVFPACSTRCRDAAERYRKRSLSLGRLIP